MILFAPMFSFFELELILGIENFRDEVSCWWAILPPSDFFSFIDFYFSFHGFNFTQFNEIISMDDEIKIYEGRKITWWQDCPPGTNFITKNF